ncbi:hypothetical protein ACFXTI_029462 [Malus domestica]
MHELTLTQGPLVLAADDMSFGSMEYFLCSYGHFWWKPGKLCFFRATEMRGILLSESIESITHKGVAFNLSDRCRSVKRQHLGRMQRPKGVPFATRRNHQTCR